MSSRAVLQARLVEALAVAHDVKQTYRRATRLHVACKKSYAVSSSTGTKARLLALANIYANKDEDIVALIAVLLRGATVEEARGAAGDPNQESALTDSRHAHLVIWARKASSAVPLRPLAAKAQRLVAEARVAVWVRRMNRKGVAPLAGQIVERLFEEWPDLQGMTVDLLWKSRLRRSPAISKAWVRLFSSRWGCKWQALPARCSLEPAERRRRAARLISVEQVGGQPIPT